MTRPEGSPADFGPFVCGPVAPQTPVALIDGEWHRADAYGLTITTQALQYGTGVFEGIRAYRDARGLVQVLRLADHVARFFRSCHMLRLDVGCTPTRFAEHLVALIERNGYYGDTYVRPIAIKSRLMPGAPFGVQLASVETLVAAYCLPMPPPSNTGTGIRCAVSSWRRVPDECLPARAKITGGYVNVALAVDEAQAGGYDDAILLNVRGTVAEASTANVFVVRDGALVTPSIDSDILEGVTRACVIEIARALGLGVSERTVLRSELLDADEVFLTGTGCEIQPVINIDGHTVGDGRPGDTTVRLLEEYKAAARGDRSAYVHWLTGVKVQLVE
jgi:branched-chain amino acid aminotransferase